MPFDIPHIDDLGELLNADHQNRLPEDDVSQTSDTWKRNRVTAGAVADNHAHIVQIDLDLMPDTAEKTRLDRHGAIWSVARKSAIAASGESTGLILGTVGSTWAATDVLVHASGARYLPTSSGTIPSGGSSLVGVIAEDGGANTSLGAGEVLTWESTPTGLEDEVELQIALTGGADAETDGAYRTRLLNRIGQPAMGGNANDWAQWILESSADIATAYVWPNRNGPGSVDIAGLKAGRGSTRILSASERGDLLAYVNARRPVAAAARVLETTEHIAAVGVHLIPESDPQWAQDWDDATPPVVIGWNSATRLITFNVARPASMAVGHRIVITGINDGTELTIESFSGTSAVVVVDAKGVTPFVGDDVYSGGPLVTPARDAILGLFDSLGPRNGDYGTGAWVSTLYLSHLFELAQTQAGVLDSTIVIADDADIEPLATTYPNDDSVNFISPYSVFVRYV